MKEKTNVGSAPSVAPIEVARGTAPRHGAARGLVRVRVRVRVRYRVRVRVSAAARRRRRPPGPGTRVEAGSCVGLGG